MTIDILNLDLNPEQLPFSSDAPASCLFHLVLKLETNVRTSVPRTRPKRCKEGRASVFQYDIESNHSHRCHAKQEKSQIVSPTKCSTNTRNWCCFLFETWNWTSNHNINFAASFRSNPFSIPQSTSRFAYLKHPFRHPSGFPQHDSQRRTTCHERLRKKLLKIRWSNKSKMPWSLRPNPWHTHPLWEKKRDKSTSGVAKKKPWTWETLGNLFNQNHSKSN